MRVSELGRAAANAVLRRAGRVAGRVQEQRGVETDVLESDDEYLVVFDAPGAAASDLEVRYDDRRVRVQIDRFRDYREGFEMRVPGRGLALDGTATLPGDADVHPDAARARLNDDGTLYVSLPKAEEATGDGSGSESETGTSDPDAETTDADGE